MYDQREDDRGYLVYVNRYNGTNQSDNPNLTYAVNKINERFSASKYSTYRCACKLFALQKALFTCYIPFKTVCTILERHRLNQIDSAPSIKPTQLTAILHDVFFAAEQLGYFSETDQYSDRDTVIATVASLLWGVYDPKRCNPLSILELKQTFLLLCEVPNIDEIVWEHFQLTSDHNLCVSRHRFEAMLINLAKLLSFVGEPDHLKINVVQDIVNECFVHYPGLVGLTEYQFSCLWKLSSKFSYYSNVIMLTRRLRESEFVIHNVQCSACRDTIQGLRFKCQKCRNLSLCINCFSYGFTSKTHNIGHKMFEISTSDVSNNKLSAFLLKFCNLFTRSAHDEPQVPQPSTFDNMEAKLIDTNSVELQQVVPPAACSTLRGTPSRSANTTCSSLRKSSCKNVSIFSNIDCQLFTSIQSHALNDMMLALLERFEDDVEKYRVQLANFKANNCIKEDALEYFDSHGKRLTEQLKEIKDVFIKMGRYFPQNSSTPYRERNRDKAKRISLPAVSMVENLNNAGEMNKSFINGDMQPNFSVCDVSSWFHLNRPSETILRQLETDANADATKRSDTTGVDEISRCIDNLKIDTQMTNFRDLLLKVREIVDDSYSDNTDLARTTQQLEKALDRIIIEEERKRIQSVSD